MKLQTVESVGRRAKVVLDMLKVSHTGVVRKTITKSSVQTAKYPSPQRASNKYWYLPNPINVRTSSTDNAVTEVICFFEIGAPFHRTKLLVEQF